MTYTVVAGDTLWGIAVRFLGNGRRWGEIARLNDIPTSGPKEKVGVIYVGDVLKLPDDAKDGSGSTNNSSTPTIENFGIQAQPNGDYSNPTIYAAWKWDKDNTENYEVRWYYDTGNGIWFVGSDGTTEHKQSTYNAPDNAKKVKFKVKPVSKKHKVNGKETDYWTANWSTDSIWSFADNPPSTPEVPTVEIKDYKLTAHLSNIDVNATHIQFEVVKDDSARYKLGTAEIKTDYASYSCTVAAGSKYKVRCRSARNEEYSEWSKYSENASTAPAAPSRIIACKATSETSVYLEWEAGNSAETYDIEYATEKRYLEGSNATSTQSTIDSVNHYELTGLEPGKEYFFRVRSVNQQGFSAWTGIRSVILGKKPSAPTTWSSTTTAITGEPLTLNWIHNSEDGSTQTYAKVELNINGVKTTHTINSTTEEDDEKTMTYAINTAQYVEGTKIQWKVQTAGVTREYSDWSIERTVDIYAPPTLELNAFNADGEAFDVLTSFPFTITGITGPNTQSPIGYHISIVSKDSYETVDNIGNVKMVSAGQEVYSRHLDIADQLELKLSAGDVALENNVRYTINCRSSMDSGLTADASVDFTVQWTGNYYEPNAEISIDKDILTASIRPYCENEFGVPIDDVTLSVYRREYDGSFTELMTGIDNASNTFITDPHPALDFARYRVVAISNSTGAVSFCDLPGYPIGEKAVIIQWDDAWSNFNVSEEDSFEEPLWSGSMLKLPYNIDVSNEHEIDVSLVEYIGRKHPVSYYGTQLGESATWKVEIDKEDTETLYALRRLATWMGDVYVREPSGSGYWASISVSFSQEHLKLTIPVTLSIRRVSGGV